MKKEKDLLRFLTCGSVDDGKSTLLGRILCDSKQLCKDQISILEKDSKKHGTTGNEEIDYALLLDGLSAEREQGITIDVAYRYFQTPKRKFIVADTPGHEQYTRNMITGASTANLAIILIDARFGVITQTKRHAFIASLLQIPHLVVAVNKMDLVDYSEEKYNEIVNEFKLFCQKLDIHDISFIPVSALKGDNVVEKSKNTPWYNGKSVLPFLEDVYIAADKNLVDFRFPVQNVIRPNLDYRGFAGKIDSGTIKKGENIIALPSMKKSKIKSIDTYEDSLEEAFAPQSVVLTLEDEIDISRGDMIVRENNIPQVSSNLDAYICWMSEEQANTTTQYLIKHTTQTVKGYIENIVYKVDVNSLHREKTSELELNDIARVELRTSQNLFFDAYKQNHATGSFIIIDPISNNTVGVGMITKAIKKSNEIIDGKIKSENITKIIPEITQEMLEKQNGHQGSVLWLTGLSGSGKSTIAKELQKKLYQLNYHTKLLDGDNVRFGLCSNLGFSSEDRKENIRRVAETAKLFYESGIITICAFISPYQEDRDFARSILPKDKFIEIFIKCDIEECKKRDPKGLYKKAIAGEIKGFTGIDSPYEEPSNPEIVIETDKNDIESIVNKIITYINKSNL